MDFTTLAICGAIVGIIGMYLDRPEMVAGSLVLSCIGLSVLVKDLIVKTKDKP